MLTIREQELVRTHARIPEQVLPYVTAVSGGEPFLSGEFVFYRSGRSLVFVGYPLQGEIDHGSLRSALTDAIRRARPDTVSVITPLAEAPMEDCEMRASDSYYGLSLPLGRIPAKVANMLRRASRELRVQRDSTINNVHLQILGEFLAARDMDRQTGSLLSMIPRYVRSSESAIVFTAYDAKGRAVGFSVADYWADRCACYMFNITTKVHRPPGASDLLLSAIVQEAQASGKAWINMGLGVNRGISFFKTKWGAQPACDYYWFSSTRPQGKGPAAFFRNILGG